MPPLASLGEVRPSKCNKNQRFYNDFKIAKMPPRDLKGPPSAPAKPPQAPQGLAMERQGPPKGPPRVPRDPQGPPQESPESAQAPPPDTKDLLRDLQEAPRDLQGPPRSPKNLQNLSNGPLVIDFGTVKLLSMTRPGGMRGAIKPFHNKSINRIFDIRKHSPRQS